MSRNVVVFWPGDYRKRPNDQARPHMERATEQIVAALRRLGRKPKVLGSYLTRPDQSISKLGNVDDPMIGLFVHWVYGPHTTDGVVGRDNPLLLASNFDGTWPGLVGLLNTGACLATVERPFSRIWTEAKDWSKNKAFMNRLDEWCSSGAIRYRTDELHAAAPISREADALAADVHAELRRRRPLILMLGDTSMGMINGYFGPSVLAKVGFSEHKVDQAWLLHRKDQVKQSRVDDAFKFVKAHGVKFHWGEAGAEDFTEESTREQLRLYCTVLDLVKEFKADCIGWQYQLGLIHLLAPSDFAEGLLNSACRPESNGEPLITATEADQGNVIPMEMMKRLLRRKGLHPAVMFHDVRWGARHKGRFLWVLLNSGSCGAYAFNHNPDTLRGVHSYRQPSEYFPTPGGSFAGESKPGKMTWARAYLADGKPWMDIGRGDVVKLPPKVRDRWWNGTTREWPLMIADLGCSMETVMAHYMSNHIAVAYGDIFGEMISLSRRLGFQVRIMADPSQI